jgi:hypothetical protein
MANWKKIIVSGSSAELNQITASSGITGSFYGDGSGLTGVTAAEWDGSHIGDSAITGTLYLSGSGTTQLAVEGNVSASGKIIGNQFGGELPAAISGSWQGQTSTFASLTPASVSGSYKGDGVISSSYQIESDISGSWQGQTSTFASLTPASVSGSYKGDGVISSSYQIESDISGSWQGQTSTFASLTPASVSGSYKGDGVISSSYQIESDVSGSWQGQTSTFASLTPASVSGSYKGDGVISSSYQIRSDISGSWQAENFVSASEAREALNADFGANFQIGTNASHIASFAGGVTIGQDLIVNGTTTTIASTTLAVADQFIFVASGSQTINVDAGLVVQSGSISGSGSAIYHDISSHRWAVAKLVDSNATGVNPIDGKQEHGFVVTVKKINLSNAAPHDLVGDNFTITGSEASASYGVGEIIIDGDGSDGNIWILGT